MVNPQIWLANIPPYFIILHEFSIKLIINLFPQWLIQFEYRFTHKFLIS